MILTLCPNPAADAFWFLETSLQPGESHRISSERRYPGGKGTHVAMAVAELGEPSTLLGIWAGATGRWLRSECKSLGVACQGIEVPGENRSCLTLRTKSGEWKDTELLGIGPSLQPDDYQRFVKKYARMLPKAKVVVLSGSWPPGAPADPYGIFIDLAKKQGIPVWLDCSGHVLEQALLHRPTGLHLNQKEAATGVPEGWGSAPENYYLQFVETLALTAGKDGLQLSTASQTVRAACPLDRIISAVGSGDCLTAGLAVAQSSGYSMEESARLGTACGSANCLREELGMLHRKEVERLLGKVVIG